MQRNIGQKIALLFAVICYLAAIGCLVASVWYEPVKDSDPIQASLIASIIFFGGCGIVLQVIARTRLKGLVSLQDPENNPE
ncbi:MAG: hypothetical protein ACLFQT_03280 [Thiohalophilus sp.]